MAMNLEQELTEAREAATVLVDLQRQAERLPELEQRAEREQRIENATARLAQAVAIHKIAATDARVKMTNYHQRLVPIIAELDALAEVLGEVGSELRDAVVRVNSACYDLGQARSPAAEDYHQAQLNAYASEAIVDELGLPTVQDLGPWTRDPGVNALIKLIVDRATARGGTVFDPAFPIHL